MWEHVKHYTLPGDTETEDFQFIELFCGSKMATRCVSGAGYRATCIDIQDHEGAGYACGEGTVFDILSSSGMVLLRTIIRPIRVIITCFTSGG